MLDQPGLFFFWGRGGRVLLGDPAKLVESFHCQVCPAIEAGMPQASADLTQNDCVVQKNGGSVTIHTISIICWNIILICINLASFSYINIHGCMESQKQLILPTRYNFYCLRLTLKPLFLNFGALCWSLMQYAWTLLVWQVAFCELILSMTSRWIRHVRCGKLEYSGDAAGTTWQTSRSDWWAAFVASKPRRCCEQVKDWEPDSTQWTPHFRSTCIR